MIYVKMTINATFDITLPVPNSNRETVEKEMLTSEAKEELAKGILEDMIGKNEKDAVEVKLNNLEITVHEI